MGKSELIKKAIVSVMNDEIGYNTNDEKVEVLQYLFECKSMDEAQDRWAEERTLKEGASDEK